MAEPRSVTDYLNLPRRLPPDAAQMLGLPKQRVSTTRLILTENSTDEYGPVEVDALYLVHFLHQGPSLINLTQIYLNSNGRWVRVRNVSHWTRERMFKTLYRLLQQRAQT